MDPTFELRDNGYVATFRGSLSVAQLELVRERAAAAFPAQRARWAVLDMLDAWVDPATSLADETRQLKNVHLVAERVCEAATPALRMAIVSNDDVTATLLRLTTAAVELAGSGDDVSTRALELFADRGEAEQWASLGS